MSALDELEKRLAQALAGRPRQLGWGDLPAMSRSLEAVRQAFGDRRGMGREQRVARGVMAFRIQGESTDFVYLKYACQGLAQPMDWESGACWPTGSRCSVCCSGCSILPMTGAASPPATGGCWPPACMPGKRGFLRAVPWPPISCSWNSS